MLAGAFPMVYLIRKYASKPLETAGKKLGLSSVGSAGILATSANILGHVYTCSSDATKR